MNEKTKNLMLVGEIRKALNELCAVLGHDYSLYIPTEQARIDYEALEKDYTDFYELPLQERFYESGMSTKPAK
jgi:hypothetical protein